MPEIFLFILFALLTIAAGEFQNLALLHGNPFFFLGALVVYSIVAIVFYFIGKVLDKITGRRADIFGYFIAGLIGLVIIEWILLKNHPGSGKGALQAGMFAWWAALYMVPRIFTKEEGKVARKRVAIALIAYSVISLAVTIATFNGAFTGLLLALGFIIINFQFLPYFERDGKRRWLRIFMWLLIIGFIVNVAMW